MKGSAAGHLPLVSCIMPTFNRRRFVKCAIHYFLRQDYPNKELVIIDDGADRVADLIPTDPQIRYFELPQCTSTGAKRNLACKHSKGAFIAHWDDDDWYAPWRLTYQVEQLLDADADISGLNRVLFYAPKEEKAWEYVYPPAERAWVYGASLCYTRLFFESHPFPDIRVGEDTCFVWADSRARVHALKDFRFLVALVHGGNASPKQTADPRYQPRALDEVEALLGEDLPFYARWRAVAAPELAKGKSSTRRALISAAQGIGDILRVTPLIRVAHGLGFEVDVLLATDYPEVAQLLEGAPEIRQVIQVPCARGGTNSAGNRGLESLPVEVASTDYEVAAFTAWSAPICKRVRARQALVFDHARWLTEGDSRSVERIARDMGWQGDMPEPFAMASARRFDLPPGTVAIHFGCKAEWPWKKWHGFDALAQRFQSVVIVGTQEDLLTEGTYFHRDFRWPVHVQNFVGKLGLADTAALLRECAALVSNDSGLMHLAAALGVPTFGIFGITSPQREGMPLKNFHPITKGLPCEAACHAGSWGRRDCEYHLSCLKTLSPEEVFMKISATLSEQNDKLLPPLNNSTTSRVNTHGRCSDAVNMTYYGNMFDASGYGHAARAYLHALHSAGVELRVVDLAAKRSRQVEDPLLDSFVGKSIDADFHLFHGPPPQWAHLAFPLRNVIAMTVWETDTMPTQWRPVLSHALDVWLPCEFNAAVFSAALGKSVFKLPHPVFSGVSNGNSAHLPAVDREIQSDDYVFYAIFEWQDRKSPERTLEAYFRAFPKDEKTVLILKTNPGAADVARRALEEIHRRTGSRARAVVRPEAWTEAQIAALHSRGDCYVSLHRGEGWGYPLFEAAVRGKPLIATGYSGPLDYLGVDAHYLVRHTLTSVRQPYVYYHPSMHWAEPDTGHASEHMRTVRSRPEEARARAGEAAKKLAQEFSLEAIGKRARQRLTELLRRPNIVKRGLINGARQERDLRPTVPIPGEWFDADYFEHGRKSNWKNGYHWRDFAGLFRETAEFLATMFPEAESFIDAGCAKGFLVRALRERKKEAWGFDHSHWAIEHAEESARPFLLCKSAGSAVFDRSFDVTMAFSLLENLTEEQALQFLQCARVWTRQALVAVVLTCEGNNERARILADDRDLAHLTLQSRAWWHERFLRAGWRQDALHRVSERACQIHPLPSRMNWKIFAYAP